MADEGTIYTDAVTVAAAVEVEIAEYLNPELVLTGRTEVKSFAMGESDSLKLRKQGAFTATAGSEDTAHAREDYEQSSPVTLTAVQAKVFGSISKKAGLFSRLNMLELTRNAAIAVAQKMEVDGLALSAGFSNSVGSTGVTLTVDDLLAAGYTLNLSNSSRQRMFILHPTQVYNVQSEILTTVADAFSHPAFDISILSADVPLGGYVGSFMGVPIYQSTNVPDANGSTDHGGMLITPRAIVFGDAGGIEIDIDKDLEKSNVDFSADAFYDWGEGEDLDGVEIISAQ